MANLIIDIRDIPIYYINLDSDIEKKNKIENILLNAGFKNINRVSGLTGTTSVNGCARSHQNVLQNIKFQGPFLVLEDDVNITEDFNPKIEVPENSDAVYLGTTLAGRISGKTTHPPIARKENKDYYQIYNMLSAHAILYTSEDYVKFLSRVIKLALEFDTHQDIIRASSMKFFSVYAISKPMFFQDDDKGDVRIITKAEVDRLGVIEPTAESLDIYCPCHGINIGKNNHG